jgi:mxaJ protein
MTFSRTQSAGRWLLAPGVLLLLCGLAPASWADQGEPLRVCADPDNLPYSNRDLQGFENKIAEVVAKDLGVELKYYWWPHQRGLVKNTLQANECDVLIGIPKGFDPVLWTRPYYRSGYVMTYLSDRKLALKSLDDPSLKKLRIGVHANTPPYDALANRGLAENLVIYRLFFDARAADSIRPQQVLEDVVSGAVDVAAGWGPLVGYFIRQHPSPALEVVALSDDASLPMTFEYSMGVRKDARALKAQLEETLNRKDADIRGILADFGVPLLPLKPPGESVEKPPPAGSHHHDPDNP